MSDDYDGSSGDTDDGFNHYAQTTKHPGASLFICTVAFCVASLLSLPIFVAIGNRRSQLRKARKERRANAKDEEDVEEKAAVNTWGCGDCHGCYTHTTANKDDDDLSFLGRLEKKVCYDNIDTASDDDITMGERNEPSSASQIIQTPFCLVASGLDCINTCYITTNATSKTENCSPSRANKRKHPDRTDDVTQTDGSVLPLPVVKCPPRASLLLERQLSRCSTDSSVGSSLPGGRRKKKMMMMKKKSRV